MGSACKTDGDCGGYSKPSCLTVLQPLKGKILDPTHPQANQFENDLKMEFPGGYCATQIADSCKTDADCGPGGGCFRGLEGVDKAALQSIDESKTSDGMHPFLPFSAVAFADVGICLKPCKTKDDCRASEGYECAVPMGTFIEALNPKYSGTFCVAPFSFQGSAGAGGSGGSAACPPSNFSGLSACASPTKPACLTCLCDDTSPSTACASKYAACRTDENCSKAVECMQAGCPASACEGLVGGSLQKLLDLTPCLQSVCLNECTGGPCPDGACSDANECCADAATSTCGTRTSFGCM